MSLVWFCINKAYKTLYLLKKPKEFFFYPLCYSNLRGFGCQSGKSQANRIGWDFYGALVNGEGIRTEVRSRNRVYCSFINSYKLYVTLWTIKVVDKYTGILLTIKLFRGTRCVFFAWKGDVFLLKLGKLAMHLSSCVCVYNQWSLGIIQ